MNIEILLPYKISPEICDLIDILRNYTGDIPPRTNHWAIIRFYAQKRCDLTNEKRQMP